MTFELPEKSGCTSDELRTVEQEAPNVTPKAVRAALVKAAAELEQWERKAQDVIAILTEAQSLRVGEMDSHSRAVEIDRRVKQALKEAVERLGR